MSKSFFFVILSLVSQGLLTWQDVAQKIYLHVLDRIGLLKPHHYMSDVLEYLGLDEAQVEKLAREARQKYRHLWVAKDRRTETSYQAYWAETKHVIYFFPWTARRNTYHWVTKLTPGPRILEYGCGTADFTYWLLKRYPSNTYTVADLEVAASLDFVRFRFAGKPVEILKIGLGKDGLPLRSQYDFIFCRHTLEHTVNPDEIVEHFFEHLAPGGILYVDFINPNPPRTPRREMTNLTPDLVEAVQRRETTIDFLEHNFEVFKPLKRAASMEQVIEGWEAVGLYRKPKTR